MDSIENILKSKDFVKCESCDRICRPWHLGTNYIHRDGGKYPQGYCPHCKSTDYRIREYSDEEIQTIQDIVDIKTMESDIIKNKLKNK